MTRVQRRHTLTCSSDVDIAEDALQLYDIISDLLGPIVRRDVEWASRKWRGKHIVNVAYRALLGACIYHIWRERNLRRFEHTHWPEAALATCIIEDVKQRIISINLSSSISTCALYGLWRIPWSVGGTTI